MAGRDVSFMMPLPERALLVAFLVGLASCGPPARREALVKEVLTVDPEFSQILDKHQETRNRIETFKRELALKRSTIDHSIQQLRKELATAVLNARQKTEEAKKRMEPDHARLTLGLSIASEELKAKRLQRSSLGRQIAQLRKTLKGDAGATWTPQERSHREAQLEELLKDTQRIDQEIASLREHVRLLKLKLLLIKL
jgi:chromosome segregation ATPase